MSEKPPYFGAPGFSESYWIELLFDQFPSLDVDALVRKLGGPYEIAVNQQDSQHGAVTIANRDHPVPMEVEGKTARVPALTNIFWGNNRIDIKEYKAALDQTWYWDGARKALGRCWYGMLIGDLTGSRLPYRDRFEIVKQVAVACADLTHPLVCHWKEAGCLVDPARIREDLARVCNVRQFDVGISGDRHMDTLGLAAIGLPDVELTFSRLDPGAVAAFLYRTAAYLFERGDVIKDGDTVPGPEGLKWKTAHEIASVGPPRTVVRVTVSGAYAPNSAQQN